MKNTTKVFIFLYFLSYITYAQNSVQNLNLDADIDAWHNQLIGSQSYLSQQGSFYPIKGQAQDNHQFYQSMEWTKGVLIIDGYKYENIDLLYNTLEDVLLTKNEGQFQWIYKALRPSQSLIQEFLIYDKTFVNIPDSTGINKFYQLLHKGNKIKFLAERKKKKAIESEKYRYQKNDQLWILKEGIFTKFSGKKTLYKLFPAHKKNIKNYIRENFNYESSKTEKSYIKIVQYCDKLITNA